MAQGGVGTSDACTGVSLHAPAQSAAPIPRPASGPRRLPMGGAPDLPRAVGALALPGAVACTRGQLMNWWGCRTGGPNHGVPVRQPGSAGAVRRRRAPCGCGTGAGGDRARTARSAYGPGKWRARTAHSSSVRPGTARALPACGEFGVDRLRFGAGSCFAAATGRREWHHRHGHAGSTRMQPCGLLADAVEVTELWLSVLPVVR